MLQVGGRRDTDTCPLRARKLGYYIRSSIALARELERPRDLVALVIDPSRELRFRNGLVLRVGDRLDLLITKETLCDDVYRLAELTEPRLIVDVGAGVGEFAVSAALRFPRCRVLAFEPHPDRFALLAQNAGANGVVLESLCVAIGTQDEYVLMGQGARSVTAPRERDGGPVVPGRRLADFIGEASVDLLKIDCEGAELDVLRSLSPKGLEHVTRVALEYHDFEGEQSAAHLTSVLADAGFAVRRHPDPYDVAIGYLYARRR